VFEEEVPIHPNDIMQAERELVGSFGFQGGPLVSQSEFATALDLIADGRIDPEPMITETVSLDAVESAFESLRDPETDQIKVLAKPRPVGQPVWPVTDSACGSPVRARSRRLPSPPPRASGACGWCRRRPRVSALSRPPTRVRRLVRTLRDRRSVHRGVGRCPPRRRRGRILPSP